MLRAGFCVTVLLIAALLQNSEAKTLKGNLGQAAYRIDYPDAGWNRILIVYCHGLRTELLSPDDLQLTPLLQHLFDSGFAVAQSGYSSVAWSVKDGVEDTEALRLYFGKHVSTPSKTFVVGESLGGFFVPVLLERPNTSYSAGLAICAPLMSSEWFILRRALDVRVVFDYFFPGTAADLINGKEDDEDHYSKVMQLFKESPQKAAELRSYTDIPNDSDLASTLEIYTYILLDIRKRAHGSPFDNRNTVYQGTSDDVMLNTGVRRYSPDAEALKFLQGYYTLTGDLQAPFLAVTNVDDPIIPSWINNFYSLLAQSRGRQNLFEQRVLPEKGHCDVDPNLAYNFFKDLVRWESGRRPTNRQLKRTQSTPQKN